ncbi:MAG: c-type cytochrome [Mucilaginibacter polytrichastri]|nr:c-type cytochrome [Mucilaginibacter polytrichastri]
MQLRSIKAAALVFAAAAVIAACGGGQQENAQDQQQQESANESSQPSAEESKIDLSSNPDFKAGQELVQASDCVGCHKENEKLVGPAYKDVANKYPMGESTVNMLAKKIIEGGTGVWGDAQMTPHPQLSEDDAKKMVKYIMLLKS